MTKWGRAVFKLGPFFIHGHHHCVIKEWEDAPARRSLVISTEIPTTTTMNPQELPAAGSRIYK